MVSVKATQKIFVKIVNAMQIICSSRQQFRTLMESMVPMDFKWAAQYFISVSLMADLENKSPKE